MIYQALSSSIIRTNKQLLPQRVNARELDPSIGGAKMFFIIPKKQCTTCGEKKAIDKFHKHPYGKYGVRSICKACAAKYRKDNYDPAYYREWDKKNPNKVKTKAKKWRAKNPDYRKNHYEKNKEKVLEQSREWYRENKTRKLETSKAWKTPDKASVIYHTRRAKLKGNGASLAISEWQEILRKYGNKCLCCGRKDVKLTMDHVVPISLGGTHTADNVQPLCQSCNSAKGTKVIDYR
jgi:5-methylcytosine-specific restriction endonuclease McrA